LIRIATGGTGVRPQGALHPDLIARLAGECVRMAQSVLTMCIRAFDYLPPADVTFGAFLRALVTADWELNPLDEVGLRAAIIEACRRRGIFAVEAGSRAVNALLLDVASGQTWQKYEKSVFQHWVDLAISTSIQEQRAVTPEDEPFIAPPSTTTTRSLANQAPPVRAEAYALQDKALTGGAAAEKRDYDLVQQVGSRRAQAPRIPSRCDSETSAFSFEPARYVRWRDALRFGCSIGPDANGRCGRSELRVSDW
jgi:hypothetical protein